MWMGIGLGIGAKSSAGPAAAALDAFFANEGATSNWYPTATWPPALHVASRNQTYFGFQTNVGDLRMTRVVRYDHTARTWDGPEIVYQDTLTDDDHGTPALEVDHEGYAHAFGGTHNTNAIKHSVETSPGSNRWTTNADITDINGTYPHPIAYNSNLHVYWRHHPGAGTTMPLYYKKTTALSGGVPTWAATSELLNFGADSRVYQGNTILRGDEVHTVLVRANFGDSERKHVYYVIHNLATGAVRNYDSSHSTSSFPINSADMNTHFRVVEQDVDKDGNLAILMFDENDRPNIIYADGGVSGDAIKVITHNGTTWDAPVQIGTTDYRYASSVLAYNGAKLQAYWGVDPQSEYSYEGKIGYAERTAGVWSAMAVIASPERAHPLRQVSVVKNGHADARVIWTERADSADVATEIGDLRAYAYGDGGLLRRPMRTLWNPRDLGSKLGRWHRADNFATGRAWIDNQRAYSITPVAASPTGGATSFNGGPGVSFNGSTQYCTVSSVAGNPSGSSAGEVWIVAAPAGSGVSRHAVSYGGATGATSRIITANASDVWALSDGTTSLASTIATTDPAIVRGQWSGTTMAGWVNGSAFATPSAVIASLNTGTSAMRIGASRGTAANFFNGVISDVFTIVGTLTTDEAQKLEGWIAHNRGLTSVLASDHPYKNAAPRI